MSRLGDARMVWFITHPEVEIDPVLAVTQWVLSARGRSRMQALLARQWTGAIGAVWCSSEPKAREAADMLAGHLGVACTELPDLGENDRRSTGYLPGPEFEATADRFFAHPDQSVRGWERAVDAQARIVAAIETVLARTPAAADIAIVSHGAVGALYLCHLTDTPISRDADQPGTGGGNMFAFAHGRLLHGWRPIDV